jgi:hypothetical protein
MVLPVIKEETFYYTSSLKNSRGKSCTILASTKLLLYGYSGNSGRGGLISAGEFFRHGFAFGLRGGFDLARRFYLRPTGLNSGSIQLSP